MDINYLIRNGSFETRNGKIVFNGGQDTSTDNVTGKVFNITSYGDILFPTPLKEGRISFEITFDDVCTDTRCGIMVNYKCVNGKTTFYQAGIRNEVGLYYLDYYNGKNWDFKLYEGPNGALRKKTKYLICVELLGNTLSLYVNNVPVYVFTNYFQQSDVCGLFVCNSKNATIENVQISAKKPSVFSIMKFEKDFDELYHDVIVPVCDKYGYHAIRADECYTTTSIIQDIINELTNSSIIIADITMDNPNVFYELGYAHALNKPTILLADTEKRDKLPFDISGYRTIFYTNSIGGKKDIEKTLSKYIENIRAQLE